MLYNGISKGKSNDTRGEWWWNEEVQQKMGAKQVAYVKLRDSKTEEEKETNRASYKLTEKEAKKEVSDA